MEMTVLQTRIMDRLLPLGDHPVVSPVDQDPERRVLNLLMLVDQRLTRWGNQRQVDDMMPSS